MYPSHDSFLTSPFNYLVPYPSKETIAELAEHFAKKEMLRQKNMSLKNKILHKLSLISKRCLFKEQMRDEKYRIILDFCMVSPRELEKLVKFFKGRADCKKVSSPHFSRKKIIIPRNYSASGIPFGKNKGGHKTLYHIPKGM